MNLFTSVEIPRKLPQWTHQHRLMLLGSCFTTHMGQRLEAYKFACDVNPYGVLYNPLSIAAALHEIAAGKTYETGDLYQQGEYWHSAMHHGDFSAFTAEETLHRINSRLQQAHRELKQLDGLLLTWGTAWVYEDKASGRIVGNCHKRPEKDFTRRRLSVEEIVQACETMLQELWSLRPQLQVLFTVSPIRHVRDGLHSNQLSKATLLLAIDALQQKYPQQVSYFPAYELVVDELRDYRFYAADMVHPSEVAIEWVWQRLAEHVFPPGTQQLMQACAEIRKMLEHKPFHPESVEYKRFLGQIVLKIDRLNEKCPYLDFELERALCHTRLNT